MGKTMKKIFGIILTVIILCVAFVACNPSGPDVNKITVTFDSNDGTGTTTEQAIKKDTPTALKANSFTYEGHVFNSWNTDEDGNGQPYQNSEVVTLSDNITLYAQWATTVTPTTTNWEDGKTYTLTEDTTVSERVTVTGHVTLILPDDLTLTCKQGITVEDSNTLLISCGEKGNGKLIVKGDVPEYCAGIGGGDKEKNGGTLIVEGGILDITGGRYAAGIGGGYKGNNGFVIIHGGDVTAVSKKYDDFDYYGGAGIGGGLKGGGGTVIISGGKVSAIVEVFGSGIGCGHGYVGQGGHVSILGGEVNASGTYDWIEYEEERSEGINGYLYLNPGIKLQAKVYDSDPWTDYNGEIPRQTYLRTKR